jgi:hypothetical protein
MEVGNLKTTVNDHLSSSSNVYCTPVDDTVSGVALRRKNLPGH